MPRLVPAALAVVALLALCGCSGSTAPATPSPTPVACSLTAPGSASDAVAVTGEFDQHPTATFTTPMSVDITERTVLTTGTGQVAGTGMQATVDFTLYNGYTGAELFTTVKEGGVPLVMIVDESQFLPGLVKAVSCSPVGSRIVAVVPSGDAYGSGGNPQLGVTGSDTLVFVVDVLDAVQAPPATSTPTPAP